MQWRRGVGGSEGTLRKGGDVSTHAADSSMLVSSYCIAIYGSTAAICNWSGVNDYPGRGSVVNKSSEG